VKKTSQIKSEKKSFSKVFQNFAKYFLLFFKEKEINHHLLEFKKSLEKNISPTI